MKKLDYKCQIRTYAYIKSLSKKTITSYTILFLDDDFIIFNGVNPLTI